MIQKNFLFTSKIELLREEEVERDLPFIDSLHKGCIGYLWARLTLTSKSFYQLSYVGTGTQALGPASPGILAGNWVRAAELNLRLVPVWYMLQALR